MFYDRNVGFFKTKLAGAYYFACVGLAYGTFTSRLPALKIQTEINEAQLGLILLTVGASSFVALLTAKPLILRFTSKKVLNLGALLIALALVCLALSPNFLILALSSVFFGLVIGFLDGAMNTQGVLVEKEFGRFALSSMHAANSGGAVVGALAGSLFALLSDQILYQVLVLEIIFLLFLPLASKRLLLEKITYSPRRFRKPLATLRSALTLKGFPPRFIVLCGLMSACAYAMEGAIAEWGGLFLHLDRATDQSIAALVYAIVASVMVPTRLMGDYLRSKFNDLILVRVAITLLLLGSIVVLYSNTLTLIFVGFALIALGIAPLVPIFFSRAGSYKDTDAVQASSFVAIFSYTGLLLFPPVLGFVAELSSIASALHALFVGGLFILGASVIFRSQSKS